MNEECEFTMTINVKRVGGKYGEYAISMQGSNFIDIKSDNISNDDPERIMQIFVARVRRAFQRTFRGIFINQ